MHCDEPGCLAACPGARRDRPVRQRHRRREPGPVHRLRLLRDRLPLRRAAFLGDDREDGQVHALRRPRLRRPRARLHQGLPDRVPALRHEGRHGRARQHRVEQLKANGFANAVALRSAGRRRHGRRHRARARRPSGLVRPAGRSARPAARQVLEERSCARSAPSRSSAPSIGAFAPLHEVRAQRSRGRRRRGRESSGRVIRTGKAKHHEHSQPTDPMDVAVIAARDREDVVVGNEIVRHNRSSRLIHWAVALTFFVCLLTGMPIWTPVFGWMARLFGGLSVCRVIHPWVGPGVLRRVGDDVLPLALATCISSRARAGWLGPKLFQYMRYETDDADVGKYNGGQKLLFWAVSLGALGLLLSGLHDVVPALVSEAPHGVRVPRPRRHVHPASPWRSCFTSTSARRPSPGRSAR